MSSMKRSLVVVIAALGLCALGSNVLAAKGTVKFFNQGREGLCIDGATVHALWLDGAPAGWVRSVEGGEATSDIVEEVGPTGLRKRPGAVKYANIVLRVGIDADPKLKDWIQDFKFGNMQLKRGFVKSYDMQREATERLHFVDAHITELSFPKLDAANPEPFLLTVTISPLSTSRESAPAGERSGPVRLDPTPARIVMQLTGPAGETARVSKIDAFTIKQRDIGGRVVLDISPTRVFPETNNLDSGPSVEALNAWAEDFLVAGNSTPDREWSGVIAFEHGDPDRPIVIGLDGLGIYEWGRQPGDWKLEKGCAAIPLSAGIVVNGIHLIF